MTNPTITLADLTALADSPAEQPVLYVGDDGDLDVWAAALVARDRIVLTREQLLEVTGGEPWDALDQGAREHVLDTILTATE